MIRNIISQTGYVVIKFYDDPDWCAWCHETTAELGGITQSDLDISVNLLRDRVNMPHIDMNNVVRLCFLKTRILDKTRGGNKFE